METTFCTHKGYNTVAPCDDSCPSLQKESEWEKSFEEKFPELWGSNDGREGYDSDVKSDVKSFIEETLSNREKEIAEEVEKGIISRDGFCKKAHRDPCEGCAYNSGINDALNNVLSILKHQ